MRTVLAVALSLLMVGCAWPPWNPQPPNPNPTPTPVPPCEAGSCPREMDNPTMCSDGECVACVPDLSDAIWNIDLNPGDPVCSTPEKPVKHWPPDSECPVLVEACPPPPQLPQPQCPKFTDRGGTEQCQSDACDCFCGEEFRECPTEPPPTGCANEPNLVASTCFKQYFRDEVKVATDALGDLSGSGTQEEMHQLSSENLVKVAAQLRLALPNHCIIAGIEAIFIGIREGDKDSNGQSSETDVGKYEENHTVFFGNGSWTQSGFGKYIGCHIDVAGGGPVDPPPGDSCPLPHPDLTNMKFGSKEAGNHLDTTWKTIHQCEFCESIGMGEIGGTIRCGCPVRPECGPDSPPDAICHDRAACEAELCDQKWECNGQPAEGWRGNPAQTDCIGHWKTWCSAPGSTAVLEGNR